MAAANVPTAEVETPAAGEEEEDATARAARKRYEGLLTVRAKAVKGKGAWYWAHLEPILVHSPDSPGVPKAVKLRCSLCGSLFSASNPSRTASEHLKHGTCLNFSSPAVVATSTAGPTPISTLPPTPRKRAGPSSSYHVAPLADPAAPSPLPALPPPSPRLVLSGGKEDLGALAMLEDSVKRLKSPKASPGPPLPKPQADAALSLLVDWLLESLPAVSPSALAHPKFQSFLHQIGLPTF